MVGNKAKVSSERVGGMGIIRGVCVYTCGLDFFFPLPFLFLPVAGATR